MTTDWMFRATLIALLAAGCAPMGDEDLSPVDGEPLAARESAARPEGWEVASHDESAQPDFARVFPEDRVPRIDIEMSADTQARIYDDLTQRIGGSAGVTACTGLARDAACTFLGLQGTCGPQSFLDFGGGSTSSTSSTSSSRPLTCRESDLAGALDMIPGDPVAVPVTVRHDGRVWNHVGMRFKGNSSLNGPWRTGGRKLGLRLDFDKFENDHPEIKDQRFFGFSKLVFASAYSDATLIREKLAVDLLRESGLHAAHASFYRVYVRAGGEPVYWGLYTVLEDPADALPRTQFADGTGNVYKPDGNGADFTRLDKRGIEKKSNEKADDYSDIERALAALHAPRSDAAAWRANLEAAFDVDAFLGNLAVSRAMEHFDSYGVFAHNYYLYGDPTQHGRLVWISWDHNLTWNGTSAFMRSTIMLDEAKAARWPLIRFLLDDPIYRAQYRGWLSKVLASSFDKTHFDAHATELHTRIAPYVIGAEAERAPYTNVRNAQSFQSGLTSLLASADGRRAAIVTALARESAAEAASRAAAAATSAATAPEATGTAARANPSSEGATDTVAPTPGS